MHGVGIIDQFLNVFTTAIDSGFGLIRPEVAFLTATLTVIDMVLAALFWAMGGDADLVERLVKKTLYVGFFAFLLNNFQGLARIVFDSFAGLGLLATGSAVSYGDFLQPGRIAHVGLDAGRPLLQAIGQLTGFAGLVQNFVQIAILLLAWFLVVAAFFILAVQLFVTIVEFKLTTLAGFVLVPFGLWGKSAFLAERVLGNVVTTGVKVLILAVVIGIGSTLFGQFINALPAGQLPGIEDALGIALGSLVLLGLGIFFGRLANALVSGAPQLSAGDAVGTAVAGAGVTALAGMAAIGGGRVALAGVRAAATAAGGARAAYATGGIGGVAKAGLSAAASGPRAMAESLKANYAAGAEAAGGPGWAQRLREEQIRHTAQAAAGTLRNSGHGTGPGAKPDLDPEGE